MLYLIRAICLTLILLSGMASAAKEPAEAVFSPPMMDGLPIHFSRTYLAVIKLNPAAANGFCQLKGYDLAASYEPAGYVRGYTGDAAVIKRDWLGEVSVEKLSFVKTDLFAQITCRLK